MTKKRVQLIVDLGNSQTRAVVRAGLGEKDTLTQTAFALPNAFAPVFNPTQLADALRGDYNSTTSSVFEVDLGHLVKRLEGIHASGEIAINNYGKMTKAPVANIEKHNSAKVYLALIKAFDATLAWLAGFAKSSTETSKAKVAKMIDFELSVLVPPLQVKNATEKFEEVFVKHGVSYRDVMNSEEITLNVSSVMVQPEGQAAYVANVISYSTLTPRKTATDLADKRVLILDVGAGTTDVIAVDKGKTMELSKHTIKIGGNDIVSRARAFYNQENGTDLSVGIFEQVSIDPIIEVGDKTFDVSKYVRMAQYEVANNLVVELQEFFQAQNIDLNTLNRLLVVGGGAMSSADFEPLADIIYDGILEYIPEIALVDTKEIDEDEIVEGFDLSSLRNLNLLGLLTVVALKEAKGAKA